MRKVKISVIIPFYNIEKYLKACLDSVLSQSIEDIEVICIDDGSTDSTYAMLESYKEKDPRVILLRQENSGPSVARNLGLSIACGEYISFVDSDDMIASGALTASYSLAREYNADLVFFNAKVIFESEEFKDRFQLYEEQFQRGFVNINYTRSGYEIYNKTPPIGGPEFFSLIYPANDYRTPIWLNLFSNDLISRRQFRFLEGLLHADDEFTFKAFLSAKSAVFCEKDLYYRRFRPDSIMTTPIGRKNTISRLIGQEKMQGFFESIAPGLNEKELLAAKRYLHDRKQSIKNIYMKYLTTDPADTEYHNLFASLNDYDEEVLPDAPPSFPGRVFRRIKRAFGNRQ